MYYRYHAKPPLPLRAVQSLQTKPKIFGSDHIGIVGFHGTSFVIARPAKPHDPWLQERIGWLPAKIGGGGTNIADGLRRALQVLKQMPYELRGANVLKRIWVFSDGKPTTEQNAILPLAALAAAAHININTVGFGNTGAFSENLLKRMAETTHNGRFIRVHDLAQLSAALVSAGGPANIINRRRHQMEFTVVAVDCSTSMTEDMGGRAKIEVARNAMLHLLHWKQQLFA